MVRFAFLIFYSDSCEEDEFKWNKEGAGKQAKLQLK